MSYGIDEKEQNLFERQLDELVTTPSGTIGRINPAATSVLDPRALVEPKKRKKQKPNPALAVEPTLPKAEPLSIDDKGMTFIPPPKPKPKPKPKSKGKAKVIPSLSGKDKKKIAAPVLKKKPYKVTPTLLQPIEKPLLKTDKPRYQLPTVSKKQLSTTPRKQLSTVTKLPSKSQLKLPQAQLKIPAQVSQANNRISSIRRNLDQIARNPQDRLANQKYIAQIEDKLKKVKSPSIKARLKSELNRLTAPATPAKGPAAGKRKPEVKVKPKPEVKKSAIKKAVAPNSPVKGQTIQQFAKQLKFDSVEEFKKAQKALKGGQISTAKGTTSGKPVSVVQPGQSYINAEQWKASPQYRRLEILQKLTKVKSGGKAYKTLQSQLKNIDRVIAGKDPISTTKQEKPTVTVKKVPKSAVTDPNVRYFIDQNGIRHKIPKLISKVTPGLKTGARISGGIASVAGFALLNNAASQAYSEQVAREQSALPENDVRRLLSPMQYYGGAANTGMKETIPFASKDQTLNQLPITTNKIQAKELERSWGSMTPKDKDEITYSEEFIGNNLVRIMLPDGTVNRVRNKEQFDIWNQPGSVIQIIPRYANGEKLNSRTIGTAGVVTHVVTGERTTPTGIYHEVGDWEGPGGSIVLKDENNQEIEKYIPTEQELRHYILAGMDVPEDWHVSNEVLDKIENVKGTNKKIASFIKQFVPDTEPQPAFSVKAKQDVKQEVATEIPPVEDMKLDATGYNNLMSDLSKESGVDIRFLKALGMQESGIHIGNDGKVSSWDYTGDENLGTEGSFGIFHVRSSQQGAAVEQYNEGNGTNYNWKDIANNPRLAATIGAWYFSYWLKKDKGNPYMAYMHYNGGPKGHRNAQARRNAKKFLQRLNKFRTESLNFTKKSAILEGMSKVNI